MNRPFAIRLGRRDKDLSVQIRRAGASVVSNLGEGNERIAGDRLHAWSIGVP
ncbi:MAG: four helix bundle protein [Candidatus Wallbacteria bacterium]|nr:four helix bundle protein [Candidatus Wallbacteria bacterium]